MTNGNSDEWVRRDHDTREGPSAAPWATSQRIPTPIILTVAYHSPLVMGDGEIASPANESEKDERSFAVSVRSKKQHRLVARQAKGFRPATGRDRHQIALSDLRLVASPRPAHPATQGASCVFERRIKPPAGLAVVAAGPLIADSSIIHIHRISSTIEAACSRSGSPDRRLLDHSYPSDLFRHRGCL